MTQKSPIAIKAMDTKQTHKLIMQVSSNEQIILIRKPKCRTAENKKTPQIII